MTRSIAPADKLALREAFAARLLTEYGTDCDRIAAMNLPRAIVADFAKAAALGWNKPAVIGPVNIPVREFTITFSLEPVDVKPGTPPKHRHKAEGIRDGQLYVTVDNLSAAMEAAPGAVRMMWEHLDWPKNQQPYANAERDADWLFRWWCKGEEVEFIAAAADRKGKTTERRVKDAIERVAKALGFNLARRPQA